MKLISITFDRVFDIRRWRKGDGTYTVFNYGIDDKKFCDVVVIGHPEIPVGQPLLVIFDNPDSPRKVYGWKNLATGEVTAEDGKSDLIAMSAIGLAFTVIVSPLWFLTYAESSVSNRIWSAMLLLFGILFFVARAAYHRRQMIACRMLQSI